MRHVATILAASLAASIMTVSAPAQAAPATVSSSGAQSSVSTTTAAPSAAQLRYQRIVKRVDEVPGGEVWVHCAGGYRASVAASVVAASRGAKIVSIDDTFDNAKEAGLPLVSEEA